MSPIPFLLAQGLYSKIEGLIISVGLIRQQPASHALTALVSWGCCLNLFQDACTKKWYSSLQFSSWNKGKLNLIVMLSQQMGATWLHHMVNSSDISNLLNIVIPLLYYYQADSQIIFVVIVKTNFIYCGQMEYFWKFPFFQFHIF
jgi:hypothetical protein